MSKITQGEVELTLDGEPVTLKPTLNAAVRIARHFGGLQAAMSRVNALDLDAQVIILRHGLGLDDASAKSLPDRVFKTGVIDLTGPLTTFIARLGNGGRPLDEQTTEETAPGNGG